MFKAPCLGQPQLNCFIHKPFALFIYYFTFIIFTGLTLRNSRWCERGVYDFFALLKLQFFALASSRILSPDVYEQEKPP